jgi:outer membrane protein TolC
MIRRLATLLATLLATTAVAQQPLSLETCRALALENNQQAAIAREQVSLLDHQRRALRANFLPSFSASALYARADLHAHQELRGDFISRFITNALQDVNPGQPLPPDLEQLLQRLDTYLPAIPLDLRARDTYSAALLARQPVYMGGKVRAGYRAARVGQEIATWNERLANSEVILRCDEAFWQCVKARELAEVARAYHESVTALLARVRDAGELGLGKKNDLLKIQVQLNDAELALLRARHARQVSNMNLCRVTGLPLDSDIDVLGTFPDDSIPPPLVAIAVESRPEHEILSRLVDLKTEEIKLARADHLPNIGLQATYGYLHGLEFNRQKLFNNTSFSLLLSVSVPIFHWNEGREKTRAARSARRVAELQREETAGLLTLETTLALQALEESRAEVTLARRSLEQASENLKVSAAQHALGLETISDHLVAQALWQKAHATLVEARATLQLNTTRYLKATNQL